MTQRQSLEDIIGYHFENRRLLDHAMTHSSYANEKRLGRQGSNERLEFLGDAVLELVSSEFLYRKFPSLPEGELTKKRAAMVCEPSLAYAAKTFRLPDFLLLGKGEEMTGGRTRDSIVSDAAEALIGAIYLDGGFLKAKEFVLHHILEKIETHALFLDSKSLLQEKIQEKEGQVIEYRLVREEGPDHDKSFTVSVEVNGKTLGTGVGHTKKAAAQAAAEEAIHALGR